MRSFGSGFLTNWAAEVRRDLELQLMGRTAEGSGHGIPQVSASRWRSTCVPMVAFILLAGCGVSLDPLLPEEAANSIDAERFALLARLIHITDIHVTDEESPARLTAFAGLAENAWRPQEAYSTQVLDGFVRTINKMHVARHPIDFVIVTGDATDNAQLNELSWFITIMDGGRVDPLTGPDDRDPGLLPDPLLDPHQPFEAQGLYRNGVHGDALTIDWYSLLGNHDRFAVGVFPIVTDFSGRRISLLPLQERVGLFFPVYLDPIGSLSWAPITPGNPGPPPEINLPRRVQANPERRYFTDQEFVQAHLQSVGGPPGHGFDAGHPERTWYSVSPLAGLRLIGLNSATPQIEVPTLPYSEGAISFAQVRFLERELARAQEAGEWVIVATHHPSDALERGLGTAISASAFRRTLNRYPCVRLHLSGHWHEDVVFDRGGYREIVTGSALDRPQRGRVVELWRQIDPQTSEPAPEDITIRYWYFSHLDEIAPPDGSHAELFDDPLLPMRRVAAELAR